MEWSTRTGRQTERDEEDKEMRKSQWENLLFLEVYTNGKQKKYDNS